MSTERPASGALDEQLHADPIPAKSSDPPEPAPATSRDDAGVNPLPSTAADPSGDPTPADNVEPSPVEPPASTTPIPQDIAQPAPELRDRWIRRVARRPRLLALLAGLTAVTIAAALFVPRQIGPSATVTTTIGFDAVGLAMSAGFDRLVAAGDDGTAIIDPWTNTIIATVPTGPANAVAVSADGRRAYVGTRDGNLVVIDDTTITATVRRVGVIIGDITISPDQRRVYVTTVGGVAVVDTETLTVAATIPDVADVTFEADGSRVYAIHDKHPARTVALIDSTNNSVVGEVKGNDVAVDVVVAPDGQRTYLAFAGGVAELDGDSWAPLVPMDSGTHYRRLFAISPDGTRLFVLDPWGDGTSTLTVIDPQARVILATLTVPDVQFDIVVAKDGRSAYLANSIVDGDDYGRLPGRIAVINLPE